VLRTLIHHWRIHLAVMIGAAVACTVLAGALLVGDSVRGSLRELTLDRLGSIDHLLVSSRFMRQTLAEELAADPAFAEKHDALAPLVILRGSAVHADRGKSSLLEALAEGPKL
jgi:putative ABC transport system permease protein